MSLRKFSFTTVLLGLAAFARSGGQPIRRGGVKLPWIRAIGRWTMTALVISSLIGSRIGQTKPAAPHITGLPAIGQAVRL